MNNKDKVLKPFNLKKLFWSFTNLKDNSKITKSVQTKKFVTPTNSDDVSDKILEFRGKKFKIISKDEFLKESHKFIYLESEFNLDKDFKFDVPYEVSLITIDKGITKNFRRLEVTKSLSPIKLDKSLKTRLSSVVEIFDDY